MVILDIPLLLENNIYNRKKDILVFVDTNKKNIRQGLKKRENYNNKLFEKFKKIQFSTSYKKRRAQFIIKNKFTKKSVNIGIKNILTRI